MMEQIVQNFLSNPAMGVIAVILAIVVCKALKIAGKMFHIIMCVAIIYAVINFAGIF